MTPVEISPISRLTTTTATSMRFIGSRSCSGGEHPGRRRLLGGDLVGAVGREPSAASARAQAAHRHPSPRRRPPLALCGQRVAGSRWTWCGCRSLVLLHARVTVSPPPARWHPNVRGPRAAPPPPVAGDLHVSGPGGRGATAPDGVRGTGGAGSAPGRPICVTDSGPALPRAQPVAPLAALEVAPPTTSPGYVTKDRTTSVSGPSSRGGAEGIRTPDLLIANETRYQLRHSPAMREKR